MLARLFLSLTLVAVLWAPLNESSAAELRVDTSRFGVSLGSDAYLVEIQADHKLPRNLQDLQSVLVPPGTLFLVFTSNVIKRPGKPTRYLALSEFGDWMYIPGDSSNLVAQDNLLHALQTGTGDFEWHAFSRPVRTSHPKVTFTSGELVKVARNPRTGGFLARIERDDEITSSKYHQAVTIAPELNADGVVVVELNPQDSAFHFRIPVEEIVNYLSIIEWGGLSYGSDPSPDQGIFGFAIGESSPQKWIQRRKLVELFNVWPKTIKLGTLFSISCYIQSAEQVTSEEEVFKMSLSAGIKVPFPSAELSAGIGIESISRAATNLTRSFVPGYSASEVAYLHLSNSSRLLTFASVAECQGAERTEPTWHRMHWEGSIPYLFDRKVFETVNVHGVSWDTVKGVWEIECFYGAYRSLQEGLARWADNDKQVSAFLTRYVRPRGDGRWRAVFECESLSGPPVPQPRPATEEQQISHHSLQ